jgi:hypothetical protein
MNVISTDFLFVVILLGHLADNVHDGGIFSYVAKGVYVPKSCGHPHIMF